MGVYIDMEMPKSCEECRFCVNGWCYVLRPESEEERKRITTNYCPLIEIPPHGRLIDADALKENWTHRDLDLFAQGWGYLKDLNRAPTIIPAEDDKILCRCGGRLSEVRYHNGRPYRHCFDCHREYYEEGDNS